MMMAKNTEIELKLLLSKEALEKMLALDFMVQAIRPGSKKVRHLVSTYYDTQDMALKKQGIAFRVRAKGDGSFEETVKTSKKTAGALSERLELNLPLLDAKPVLTGFQALGLDVELSELAPQGVQPLFTVDVERITYIIDYEGSVSELAIDKGAIYCGAKSDSIDEVELELLEGDVSTLLALKERIAAQVTLRAEDRSKFARGLALLEQSK